MKKLFPILIMILFFYSSCQKDIAETIEGKYQVSYFSSSIASFDSTYTENTSNITVEVKKNPSSSNQYFILFPEDELVDFANTEIKLSSFKSPLLDENNIVTIGELVAYHSSVDGFIKNDSIYLKSFSGCCGNFSTHKIEGTRIQE